MSDDIGVLDAYQDWVEERTLNGDPSSVDAYKRFLAIRRSADAMREINAKAAEAWKALESDSIEPAVADRIISNSLQLIMTLSASVLESKGATE